MQMKLRDLSLLGTILRMLLPRIRQSLPPHITRGAAGETAACQFLKRQGFKLLARNFRTRRGEIDLVFKDGDCLVFVEVKTRTSEDWVRPAAAITRRKRRALTRAAFDYLRTIGMPMVKIRFDVVEVLMEGDSVREIRHLPNAFGIEPPYRFG